jgi:hypothetical protein
MVEFVGVALLCGVERVAAQIPITTFHQNRGRHIDLPLHISTHSRSRAFPHNTWEFSSPI